MVALLQNLCCLGLMEYVPLFKATTRGKMLCLGPKVVALIIFTRAFSLIEPIYQMEGIVIVDIIKCVAHATSLRIAKHQCNNVLVSYCQNIIEYPVGGLNTVIYRHSILGSYKYTSALIVQSHDDQGV